jgi:pilus assembly protein CpaF
MMTPIPIDSQAGVMPPAMVPGRREAGWVTRLFQQEAYTQEYQQLKFSLHNKLLNRVNLEALSSISSEHARGEIRAAVARLVDEEKTPLSLVEKNRVIEEVLDEVFGLGPLEPLLNDDQTTDILVNGPFDIYVERQGKLEKTRVRFRDSAHLVNVAQRIASAVGRRIDEASPMVDARLADGSRVNIVLPPLVLNGGCISIRKFAKKVITLDDMADQGNLSPEMARFLEIAARARFNIVVSGGTGSGKTTLLNAISRMIDPFERIVTIEDAVELRLQQPHVVQMETRAANIEGVGAIPQRELVRNALRMRPDRIIVGEVRGVEAFDMLQAMNTGHDGSMSTIHANAPRDALYRLENMVMMAATNLMLRAIRMQIASAVHLIVHIERMRDGVRRVQTITEIVGLEGDVVAMRDIFNFEYQGDTNDGLLQGRFVSNRLRPYLARRAALYGLERKLLDAVGVGDLA